MIVQETSGVTPRFPQLVICGLVATGGPKPGYRGNPIIFPVEVYSHKSGSVTSQSLKLRHLCSASQVLTSKSARSP
jgi:hypothetical protein